jgi:hypothetical protein
VSAPNSGNVPQVAVDPAGNAYFVWQFGSGSNNIIQARRRAAGGTLGAVQDLTAEADQVTFSQPQLAVDSAGNAHFVWECSSAGAATCAGRAQTRRRSADGTLGAIQQLSAEGLRPQVATDPAGNAHFVWGAFSGSNALVQARRRAADGTLGAVQDLSALGPSFGAPQLAVDSAGNAHFVWRHGSNSSNIIQARRRAPDGTLGPVQDLSAPGPGDAPQVAADAAGDAAAVWEIAGSGVDASFSAACQDVQVGLAVARGCFTERRVNGNGTGVFETSSEAWVGGFHLKPRPGGKLVVQNRPQAPVAAEGAGVDWVLGPATVPAPVGELKPFLPDFALGLNTAGSLERFVQLPFLSSLSTQVKVTWDQGGKGSKVEASVSMEKLTEHLGTALAGRLGLGGVSVGTLAAKLGLTFKNGQSAEVTDGELEVPEVAVELKHTTPPLKEGFGGGRFKAKRVGANVEWSAEVSVLFPWQGASGTNQGVVTGRLFYTDFELAGLGLGVSGFEKPIGTTGWDLTGVEGDVIYRPRLAFNVGVKAQQHSSFAGVHLFELTGNVKALRLAEDCSTASNPYEFVGTFNAPPLEAAGIGKLKGQVLMCAYLPSARDFAFEAGISGELTVGTENFSGLATAQGSARGWFHGFDFNLDGSYRLQLPLIGTIGATGVFSSEGYALCGRYGFIEEGFGTNNWLEPPEDLVGCDFTPFRATPPPARAAVHSAAAAGAKSVEIPPRQSAFGIAVRGTGGAPRVRVVGPHGERFVTPAGTGLLKTAAAIIVPVDQLTTTYVYLHKPRPGTWQVEPLPASVAIQRLETARQLPESRVRAKVRRKGGKVLVKWKSRRVPGQKIQLVDRAAGVATTIQALTAKRKGSVRFKPKNPLARRRTIEAVLLQNGSPRPPLTVAHYKLRKLKLPGRVRKPTAKRTKQGLAVRWRKARRAAAYRVTVKAGKSVLTRVDVERLRLTVRGLPKGKLKVLITPRDAFGRSGPTAAVKVG